MRSIPEDDELVGRPEQHPLGDGVDASVVVVFPALEALGSNTQQIVLDETLFESGQQSRRADVPEAGMLRLRSVSSAPRLAGRTSS